MDKFEKDFFKVGVGMAIFAVLLNLLFWGGLIWLVVFLVDKYFV